MFSIGNDDCWCGWEEASVDAEWAGALPPHETAGGFIQRGGFCARDDGQESGARQAADTGPAQKGNAQAFERKEDSFRHEKGAGAKVTRFSHPKYCFPVGTQGFILDF